MNFNDYLQYIGLNKSSNIIVHSSYKKISSAFPRITPEEIILSLKATVGRTGSIVFPTFTYCFKKSVGPFENFDTKNSKSKVGLLSETFRLSEDVKRTNSPTHSFALWGKITRDIDEQNSPDSPLGKDSILEWLTNSQHSFVLLLGTDFSALTYGHYLEIEAKVPWYDCSPWEHLNVLPVGVSLNGNQLLKEIPGCSKSFINFEKYLLKGKEINKNIYNGLESYLISIKDLYTIGINYFKSNYESLLCKKGTCQACDSRRLKFIRI